MTKSPLPPTGGTLEHYVDDAPFDPHSIEKLTKEQETIYLASQWKLMWWKFCRHRVAVACGLFLLVLYLMILVAEFLSPYNYQARQIDYIYASPQAVHFFHDGKFEGPFVYGLKYRLNMENLRREYTPDRTQIQHLRFFCRGQSYKFWSFYESDWHLMCPAKGGQAFLLGTDKLGRDMLSRIIHGARISLTIGLAGVAVSIFLGVALGGLAGYFGGMTDLMVQRLIEVLQSLPSIPLWLVISALVPITWSALAVYLFITIILGLIEWTGLARSVRSKLLSLREEDYVLAAQLMGAKSSRVIGRHLIPGFTSHLIASATLAIPSMILGETALSFLGLGLREPITSWGVLLTQAQNINVVALYPWLMLPVVPVILVVLAFNFLGDGLRDAADPYK